MLILCQHECFNVSVSVQVAQVSKCEDLFPCVLCQVHKRGPLTQELCASNCTAVIIEEADAIESKCSYL